MALTALIAGCGAGDPYVAVEAGMRDWLVTAHQRDEAACDHMTDEYRRALSAASTSSSEGTECSRALTTLAPDATVMLPPADAAMDVPVWDPSGEALVEVKDGSTVVQFWMQVDGDRWRVAGTPD
ncbi:hypothetical protein [Mumia sp. Pv 4-285]|uniref:hypothetical protein n=1 Tax=Mumia qirimensis TaxID=3234852 RepID=UPI00351DA95A